ncbi:MAG: hypothetical protein JZD41_02590 [Thermoproteus sp.]|nr:hypothetical protein [Thermoproteus sp.]
MERFPVPNITPLGLRSYLARLYFTPGMRFATMVWGPYGVGKSSSVADSASDVSYALSNVFTSVGKLMYKYQQKNISQAIIAKTIRYILYKVITKGYLLNNFDIAVPLSLELEYSKRVRPQVVTVSSYEHEGKKYAVSVVPLSEFIDFVVENDILPIPFDFSEYEKGDAFSMNRTEQMYQLLRPLVLLWYERGYFPRSFVPVFVPNNDIKLVKYPCALVKLTQTTIQSEMLNKCYVVDKNNYEQFALTVLSYVNRYIVFSRNDLDNYINSLGGVAYFPLFQFVDLRLAQLDVEDIKGVPSDVEARVAALNAISRGEDYKRAIAEARISWLLVPWITDFGAGMLFFDEINQAPSYMQAAAYQLILDRKISTGHTYSDNVMVIAAGNQPSIAPEVAKPLPTPLLNRFRHLNMEPRIGIGGWTTKVGNVDEVLMKKTSEAFRDYLVEHGYKINIDISRVDDIKYGEYERDFVVMSPRSYEFLVASLPWSKDELYGIRIIYDRYKTIGKLRMSPNTYIAYVFASILGETHEAMYQYANYVIGSSIYSITDLVMVRSREEFVNMLTEMSKALYILVNELGLMGTIGDIIQKTVDSKTINEMALLLSILHGAEARERAKERNEEIKNAENLLDDVYNVAIKTMGAEEAQGVKRIAEQIITFPLKKLVEHLTFTTTSSSRPSSKRR